MTLNKTFNSFTLKVPLFLAGEYRASISGRSSQKTATIVISEVESLPFFEILHAL